jgi:hypothetical protein
MFLKGRAGLSAGAISFKTYASKQGTWHDGNATGVQPADVLGWNFGGTTVDDHVSVVTAVNSDGTLTTIDGNWSDRVATRTITPNNTGTDVLSGYASPVAR